MLKINLKNEYWAEVVEEGAKVRRNFFSAHTLEPGNEASVAYDVMILHGTR